MNYDDLAADGRPRATALLIAGGFLARQTGTELLANAGMGVQGPIGLAEAPTLFADNPAIDLVMIEVEGAAPTELAALIDAVAAWPGLETTPTIISFSLEQIDAVAAGLLNGRVQLLCAPDDSDRAAAIAVALAGARVGWVREDDRRREAERLQRLNEEVARIAETLARLTGREPMGAARSIVGDRVSAFRARDDGAIAVSAGEVRQAIKMRRLRDQFFGGGLFEDPAWDMLLDLFAADLERARVSVSSLCIAAAVAPTTALRWIVRMTEAGLFEREPDPFDRRRAFMVLSVSAREAMQGYCAAVRRAGGAIG